MNIRGLKCTSRSINAVKNSDFHIRARDSNGAVASVPSCWRKLQGGKKHI